MARHQICTIAVAALAACAAATTAAAQQNTDRGTTASPLNQPVRSSLPLPNEGTPQGYLFNLRPLGFEFGAALANSGIYLTGRTIDEGLGEVGGGIKRGGSFEGYTSFGVDLDMNRLAGIKGGAFHLLFDDISGQPYQTFSGSQYGFNRTFAFTPAFRLNEFSYEQSLFDGKLDVRVGRLPVGTEFDFSPVYCEFVNGLCAAPGAYIFTKGYPAYPAASTAGTAQLKLPHHFYVNAGAYEDEPIEAKTQHGGFPGLDWGLDYYRGVTIPVQFGYRTGFKDDPLPKNYSIGAFYDTGDYTDPLLNAAGRNRILNGGAPKLDHGKSEVWFQAEQMVWRPDLDSERGLTLFGGANFNTSGSPNIDQAFFVGASLKGPFAKRPNDSFNVEFQTLKLRDDYVTAVNSSLPFRTAGRGLNANESFVEVNYGLALAPGVVFKPFFQYIWNPDQVGVTLNPTNTHAVFVGAAFTASFPETFGLPRLSLQ